MVDGKVVLTALRIKEVVVEDGDDFGQTKVEQIRYLTPKGGNLPQGQGC